MERKRDRSKYFRCRSSYKQVMRCIAAPSCKALLEWHVFFLWLESTFLCKAVTSLLWSMRHPESGGLFYFLIANIIRSVTVELLHLFYPDLVHFMLVSLSPITCKNTEEEMLTPVWWVILECAVQDSLQIVGGDIHRYIHLAEVKRRKW